MEKAYLLKLFDPQTDYDTVCQWWKDRGFDPLPKVILPKLGVMAIPGEGEAPDACAWLYMDNSVGVCFLEGTISRPGLTLAQARDAIGSIIGFLKSEAIRLDYGTMITFCNSALARESKRLGFVRVQTELSMMVNNLTKEAPCQL
jgi:hypothetical protein